MAEQYPQEMKFLKANTKAKLATAVIEQKTKNIYNPETGEMVEDKGPSLNTELVWSGEPNYKYRHSKYDWLFIPLSWFIVIIAGFWMHALNQEPVLWAFASILMLFGLYCLFFRIHHKRKKRRKYSYEITETDLTIIYSTKKDVKVRQIPIENVNYIAYTMRKNKSGTVYFNFPNDYKDILKLIFAHSGIGHIDEKIFAFYDIEDIDDLIEQLKAKIGDNLRIDKI